MSDSKKAVTILGQASKSVEKLVGDVQKAISKLSEVSSLSEGLGDAIELREAKLDELNVTIKEKERAENAELAVRITENEDKVLNGLLSARGLDNISTSEVSTLRTALETAKQDNEASIASAVDVAVKKVEVSNGFASRANEDKHKVATAQLEADTKAQAAEIKFLTEAVASYKAQIEAARDAQIQIETNRSVSDMVVQTGKL